MKMFHQSYFLIVSDMCRNLPAIRNGYFVLPTVRGGNVLSQVVILVCEAPYIIVGRSEYICMGGSWNGHGGCRKFGSVI